MVAKIVALLALLALSVSAATAFVVPRFSYPQCAATVGTIPQFYPSVTPVQSYMQHQASVGGISPLSSVILQHPFVQLPYVYNQLANPQLPYLYNQFSISRLPYLYNQLAIQQFSYLYNQLAIPQLPYLYNQFSIPQRPYLFNQLPYLYNQFVIPQFSYLYNQLVVANPVAFLPFNQFVVRNPVTFWQQPIVGGAIF